MELPSSTHDVAPSSSATEPSLGAESSSLAAVEGGSSGARDRKRTADKASHAGPARRSRTRTLKPAPSFALEESDDVFALSLPRSTAVDGEPFRKAR